MSINVSADSGYVTIEHTQEGLPPEHMQLSEEEIRNLLYLLAPWSSTPVVRVQDIIAYDTSSTLRKALGA